MSTKSEINEDIRGAVADANHIQGAEFVRVICPVCIDRTGKADRRKSLSFNLRSGSYRCFKCGVEGWIRNWGEEGPEIDDEDDHEPAQTTVEKPAGYLPLWEGAALETALARPAIAYAERRCPRRLWQELQIGACIVDGEPQFGRVIVPVLDDHDKWQGWVGRMWRDGTLKPYYNMPGHWASEVLFNPRALADHQASTPLVLVEGVFDAIHLWPHAVAVLGKPGPAQVAQLLRTRRSVAVLLDGDAWREGWALAQDLRLEGIKAGSIRLPPRTDPDHYPAEQVQRWAETCLEIEDEYRP